MIRNAVVDDLPVIVSLVRELADYEREPAAVVATEDHFRRALFGPQPKVFCLLACAGGDVGSAGDADGDGDGVVGLAIWFFTFSTWLGRHGIYLEDLFVRPAARGAGHGRALLTELARIAVAHDCGRLDWAVLDWNVDAHGFYRALGAERMDQWTTWRLTGEALRTLGAN